MRDAAYRVEDLRWRLGPGFALALPALEVPRGRTTLLLGPSASGKSTLLRLLGRVEGGYFPAEEGPGGAGAPEGALWLQARAEDEPLELLGMSEAELLRRRVRGPTVGLVFQREGLFVGRGALDNVAWPLRALGVSAAEAEGRARALLDRVGLGAERAVATLSGGERKRLALARALGPRPAVLLLDEPFTGLDPRALERLREVVASVVAERAGTGEEMTVVMVTHQPEDIERFGEHVVLLEAGRLVAAGGRDEAPVAAALEAYLGGRPLAGGLAEGPAGAPGGAPGGARDGLTTGSREDGEPPHPPPDPRTEAHEAPVGRGDQRPGAALDAAQVADREPAPGAGGELEEGGEA